MQLTPESIRKQPVSEAELRSQIALPLKRGGMGLRPTARISPSAYFASAAAILPDFLRAFPSIDSRTFTDTELCKQLEECREWMRKQGVTSRQAVDDTAATAAEAAQAEAATAAANDDDPPADDEIAGAKSSLHSPSKRERSPRKVATPRRSVKKKKLLLQPTILHPQRAQ